METVCDILEQLVREGILKRYAIGGATAAGFHGEPLATRDIDVFVFLDAPSGSLLVEVEPLYRRLRELRFTSFDEEALLIHDLPVQFIVASPGLESEAVEHAATLEWQDHRMRVMTPEYLAAIALHVGRPKDRARLVFLADLPAFNRSRLEEILARHDLSERWRQWSAALGLNQS